MTSLKLALMVFSGKRHLVVYGLHQKYGKIVRTGMYSSLLIAFTYQLDSFDFRSEHFVIQLLLCNRANLCFFKRFLKE